LVDPALQLRDQVQAASLWKELEAVAGATLDQLSRKLAVPALW
jgi:hypothetical protein